MPSTSWKSSAPFGERGKFIRSRSLRDSSHSRSWCTRHIDSAVARIRSIPGREDFLADPTLADVAKAVARDTPLVYLLTTHAGSLCLIVSLPADIDQIAVEPLWLDSFKQEHLVRILGEWLRYRKRKRSRAWFKTIERCTRTLWDGLMGPLTGRLQNEGIEQATLVPLGNLGLLPLHAAWMIQAGRRRFALDEIAFAYAPSARMLAHGRRIAEGVAVNQLLAVENPQPVKVRSLLYASEETTRITALFKDPIVLRREAAVFSDVCKALTRTQVAHFACHGVANTTDPERSGLLLSHNKWLTIADLLGIRLEGARLATLSACETGIIGLPLPDQVVSLPSVLMRSGFAGVVASLWVVSDHSTALLMGRFYDLWRAQGQAPIRALREAQAWLRDSAMHDSTSKSAISWEQLGIFAYLRAVAVNAISRFSRFAGLRVDFEHPYWWAAFYLSGI